MGASEGVPADSFSALLERALGVRVDNAGVPDYSSAQMLGRLRRYLPALHPRLVVMTLSPLWDRQRTATPAPRLQALLAAQISPRDDSSSFR
jgi:hypothetical protein